MRITQIKIIYSNQFLIRVRWSKIIIFFELISYISCSRERELKRKNNYEIENVLKGFMRLNKAYRA